MKKRHRNVAHLWADKRAMRFFRKNFDNPHHKNLRSIYLALCEMDSDFGEHTQIKSFVKTLSTYSGVYKDTARKYLNALHNAGIIDVQQTRNEDGTYADTSLVLYEWAEADEPRLASVLKDSLQSSNLAGPRGLETPLSGFPVIGVSSPFKNTKVSLCENHSTNEGLNIIPRGLHLGEIEKKPSKKKAGVKERVKDYYPFAEQLATIVKQNKNIKTSQARLNSWADDFRKLSETDGVSPERIQDTLDWYADNIGGSYVPVVESGATFRQKYVKLEAAIERSQTSTSKVSAKPVRFKTAEEIEASADQIRKQLHKHFGSHDIAELFFQECYTPAKNLFSRDPNVNDLLPTLLGLHTQITKVQARVTGEMRSNLPGALLIISRYIIWISENDWIDNRRIDMFGIDRTLFNRFRQDESKRDCLGRDPLTGQSRSR